MSYIGRLAPSPTGLLHFGSLLAATASYLDARSQSGRWLLRIEDLDHFRQQVGASEAIIATLKAYGFEWDGELIFQQQRLPAYQDALAQLTNQSFRCVCTRKQLQSTQSLIYPGYCRQKVIDPQTRHAIRAHVPARLYAFNDLIQGYFAQQLTQDVGDFIIRRADSVFAYQLAVVVDDTWQGVTHIVRGSDLLDNTPRQLYLQELLQAPQPHYAHIPVASYTEGQKLSKQTRAPAIPEQTTAQILEQLVAASAFLGQQPPAATDFESLQAYWDWAIAHWDLDCVPKQMSKTIIHP